ncbi:MAG: His/Gly/Thr/Pro-type tRNA ligase C-terminal domain-containing protein, partial [Gammaproteobacteria bacterium]
FADADLIGIPHRITVGERALADGNVEYKARDGGDVTALPLTEVVSHIAREAAPSAA